MALGGLSRSPGRGCDSREPQHCQQQIIYTPADHCGASQCCSCRCSSFRVDQVSCFCSRQLQELDGPRLARAERCRVQKPSIPRSGLQRIWRTTVSVKTFPRLGRKRFFCQGKQCSFSCIGRCLEGEIVSWKGIKRTLVLQGSRACSLQPWRTMRYWNNVDRPWQHDDCTCRQGGEVALAGMGEAGVRRSSEVPDIHDDNCGRIFCWTERRG